MEALLGYFSDPNPVRARVRVLNVPQPAAGTDWTVTPGQGRAWRILSALATFTTSIVAGNRFAGLKISWAGVDVWEGHFQIGIIASSAQLIAYAADVQAQASIANNTAAAVEIPEMWLPPDSTVSSSTIGIQAADQYSAINLLVQEAWPSPHEAAERELSAEAIARELGVAIPVTPIR